MSTIPEKFRIDVERTKALQKYLGVVADGYFGPISQAAFDSHFSFDLSPEYNLNFSSRPLNDWGIDLKVWYENLWNKATITRPAQVKPIVDKIVANRERYKGVEVKTGVPWFIIACLHNMESSLNFTKHLHEGSPLTGRTKYVPKGRPVTGNPPFTWETSAIDALFYDSMDKVDYTSLQHILYAIERYNGVGYLRYHKSVPSPYLWSFTSVYTKGKYVEDGKFSAFEVSQQCGVVPILKELQSRNLI